MDFYDRVVAFNMKFCPAPIPPHHSRRYFEIVKPLVKPETYWLDVGCGTQPFFGIPDEQQTEVVSRAAAVFGIDPDESELARNRFLQNKAIGSADRLPWEDGTFDLVTASMVFEHLEEPTAALAEIRRVLKPGGAAVIATPNRFGYDTLAARLIPPFLRAPATSVLDRRTVETQPQTANDECSDSRQADRIFPTYYRFNDRAAVRRGADVAGLTVRRIHCLLTRGVLYFIPLAYQLEMLWMAALRWKRLQGLRPNFIIILEKPGVAVKTADAPREGLPCVS